MIDVPLVEKCGEVLFAENVRHKALYGGRASGRSWSIATYVIVCACRSRKLIVCARQYQNSIKDSSKELLERRIRDLGLSDQFVITNTAITHIETGSSFIFIGLERNVDSIRSLEGADIVWVEEARTVSARSLEILLPTVRAPGSELIWSWNPEMPSDPVDEYFRSREPPPNSRIAHVTYLDNRFFKDTALVSEMALMKAHNPDRYRHVWLGEYDISFERKVYTDVIVGRPEVPPDTRPLYGCDFGFSTDPSAVIKIYPLLKKRQIYIAAEAVARVPMDQLPELVRSVVRDDGDLIRADSSQPGTIEFLQARGFDVRPAKKGQGSVRTGIQFLQGYQLVVDPACTEVCNELRLYSWPTDKLTGQVISGLNPIGGADHLLDSLRYACEDLVSDAPLDDDDSGVLWLNLWNSEQRPQHVVADPPVSGPYVAQHYIPLPRRQRPAD